MDKQEFEATIITLLEDVSLGKIMKFSDGEGNIYHSTAEKKRGILILIFKNGIKIKEFLKIKINGVLTKITMYRE